MSFKVEVRNVDGCVSNDLFREAAKRGITLTRVNVSGQSRTSANRGAA